MLGVGPHYHDVSTDELNALLAVVREMDASIQSSDVLR